MISRGSAGALGPASVPAVTHLPPRCNRLSNSIDDSNGRRLVFDTTRDELARTEGTDLGLPLSACDRQNGGSGQST